MKYAQNKKVEKPSRRRVPWFDILRILMTIVVVNLHRENLTGAPKLLPANYSWYAVPLFITVSFYFMADFFTRTAPPLASLKKRINRFFLPFVFWSIAGFVVHPESFSLRNVFFQLVTGSVVNPALYYLIIVGIITVLLWVLTFLPVRVRIGVYAGVTTVMFFLQYSGFNYAFFSEKDDAIMYSYGRIAEFFPYASLGIMLGIVNTTKERVRSIAALMAAAAVAHILLRDSRQPDGVHYSGILYYTGAVAVFCYTWLLSRIRMPDALGTALSKIGAYSLGVYVSHYLLLELLFNNTAVVRDINSVYPLPFTVSFVALCYIVCYLLNRITKRRYAFLFT